jgi:quinol monooxygenase YgiN
MICLEIKAVILKNKLLEFNQSKMAFIENLQNTEGYLGFTEKQGNEFQIKILWKNRKALDIFMKSEHYRIFNGAIITLSETNSTRIFKENLKQLT